MRYDMFLILLLLWIPWETAAADASAWRSRNIYFALTDRVARLNDASTSPCSNLGNYCGGTFAGLQSKLDYIHNMGFDAIWITPVVTSGCYR
jgi:alpha-amylase